MFSVTGYQPDSHIRITFRLAFEFLDAPLGSSFERRRITRDRRLAGSLDLWQPPIEGLDEVMQFTHNAADCHRHRYTLREAVSVWIVRDTFQISPHVVHRQ